MNKKLLKFVSFFPILLFIIIYDSHTSKVLMEVIALPIFGVVLAVASLGYAYLGYIGIAFSKTHQLNPNLRSIVSYPIAIQSTDQSPLSRQQIYDTIRRYCPNCQIYFEQTSTGFRPKKAEIIVVDWEECKETDITSKTDRLNMKIIEAITTNIEGSEGCQKLEVLNFIIQRSHDGQVGNVIPIQNKKIVRFQKLIAKCSRLLYL